MQAQCWESCWSCVPTAPPLRPSNPSWQQRAGACGSRGRHTPRRPRRCSRAGQRYSSAVHGLAAQVLLHLHLPPVAIGQQLLLVVQQLLAGAGAVLKAAHQRPGAQGAEGVRHGGQQAGAQEAEGTKWTRKKLAAVAGSKRAGVVAAASGPPARRLLCRRLTWAPPRLRPRGTPPGRSRSRCTWSCRCRSWAGRGGDGAGEWQGCEAGVGGGAGGVCFVVVQQQVVGQGQLHGLQQQIDVCSHGQQHQQHQPPAVPPHSGRRRRRLTGSCACCRPRALLSQW